MTNTDIYQNIAARTGGDIYLGVVGPVRTGKSTFIKRFMDLMVLPRMEDSEAKKRTVDELPQSAQGKTIMTTEPKFIPKDAVRVLLDENLPVRIRLIDCVGYLIDGVSGHMEEGRERMVKTPWFDAEIPFAKAAMIGTEKVIREHATIGVVVTTDGSFTEIPRENYIPAEERTVEELKKIGKPFVILLNTPRPYGAESAALVQELLLLGKELNVHAHLYQGDGIVYEKANPAADAYHGFLNLPYTIDPDICKKVWHNVPKVLFIAEPAYAEEAQRKVVRHPRIVGKPYDAVPNAAIARPYPYVRHSRGKDVVADAEFAVALV